MGLIRHKKSKAYNSMVEPRKDLTGMLASMETALEKIMDTPYTMFQFYRNSKNNMIYHYNGNTIVQYSNQAGQQVLFDKDNVQLNELPVNAQNTNAYTTGNTVTME
eukprot:13279088-Ditylum_brightwellii.AAC.1